MLCSKASKFVIAYFKHFVHLYVANSASPALIVRAVTVVPNDSYLLLAV
jgi:maltodextrin utilization protein YvdJ